MQAKRLTPILNVSSIHESFAWFETLGWQKGWDWGDPPTFWVDDVDAIHEHCQAQGLDVTWPPTDMPWNVREMHVRHPDGHVFRISQGLD